MPWDASAGGLRRRLDRLVPRLAADFPGWDFAVQRTHRGPAIAAVRREQAGEPGTCAVITADPGELRRALNGRPHD